MGLKTRIFGSRIYNHILKGSIVGFFLSLLICCSTTQDKKDASKSLFSTIAPDQSGVLFENKVRQEGENNILNYSYYFNGGGVALVDINNDDLLDIYFTGNVVENKLFLNKGHFRFEDITTSSGVACPSGWKTGVTIVDINQDGWMDLYVCRSAMGDSVLRKNLLFVNQQNLTFTEQAASYHLDHAGYSTQAGFFDYDKDGDEDMFLLNHSLPEYTRFNNLKSNLETKGSLYASRLLRNEKGKFVDVSEQAGIANNVLSFGLGLAISDLNEDGWLDMYVSNDFNEQDYLYINQKNGKFKNSIKEATGHISLFSMGSDVADINNDAHPDFITLDMMPQSNDRIKLSTGDDNYDKNQVLENLNLHPQTMRNMLQLNNGDGTFAEIAQLAGVSNTDWSWSSLFADFDSDGYKDLYISNGYEKDFTNMQFLKFTADAQIKSRQSGQSLDINYILNNIPSIEEGNFLFKNNGLLFANVTEAWGLNEKFKSNGAGYGDLDNDGDLDLVVNVMNRPSILLKNNVIEQSGALVVRVDLISSNKGMPLIGTKVAAYTKNTTQSFEYSTTRGFQSAMQGPICIGLGTETSVDSLRIIWPDQKISTFQNLTAGTLLRAERSNAITSVLNAEKTAPLFTPTASISWEHRPLPVNDFKQQLLLPHMYSYSGPKMIKGDVNGDGLEDVFVTGAAEQSSSLFLQDHSGQLKASNLLLFEADKKTQDENACFFDADGDKDLDLYVVAGGYTLQILDRQDRLYINDGKGNFKKSDKAIPLDTDNGSVCVALDVDADADLDLFVGNRMIPGQYPLPQASKLLMNDGHGHFEDQTTLVAPTLSNIGMVTDATVADVNMDGKLDLMIVGEWMRVGVFLNINNKLEDQSTEWIHWPSFGWWTAINATDYDGDGDVDFMLGNAGTNNQFQVSETAPASMVFKDFDNNGQVDPFLFYYINGKQYPYASRDEALGQVGFLRNRFLDYNAYANVGISELFTRDELKGMKTLKADNLKTVYVENTGRELKMVDLPIQAQFAPVYSILNSDVDGDGDQDVLMAGNECKVRVRLGRSDANQGMVFLNGGKGYFTYMDHAATGLQLLDDTRSLLMLHNKDQRVLLAGQTGKPILTYQLNATKK